VTRLDLETPITVADLPAIPGVEYVDDPEESIFTMIMTRVEEEEEVEEEVSVEPEVLPKGKQDEEEE
jgi:hypothetical protein